MTARVSEQDGGGSSHAVPPVWVSPQGAPRVLLDDPGPQHDGDPLVRHQQLLV